MTSVLKSLSLSAYRGISGLVLDELTPVSLVVGPNNSGKSSILEAAGLLLRPPDPVQWVSAVRQRDVDGLLVDGLLSLFPTARAGDVGDGDGRGSGSGAGFDDGTGDGRGFGSGAGFGDGTREGEDAGPFEGAGQERGLGLDRRTRAIELSCKFSNGSRALMARPSVSWRVTEAGVAEATTSIDVNVDGAAPILLRIPGPVPSHQVLVYRVYTVTPATHYSTRVLVEHLSHVAADGKKQLAVELLRLFDPNVQDLDVVAFNSGLDSVRVTHRVRGVVDLASFGDGMRRAAALALALTRASHGVVLVDELEAGIHPSALRQVLSYLLEAAATSQVQILATTHSLEAVDAVLAAVEERGTPDTLSAFWVKRRDAGHESRRYDAGRLRRMREGGFDVR